MGAHFTCLPQAFEKRVPDLSFRRIGSGEMMLNHSDSWVWKRRRNCRMRKPSAEARQYHPAAVQWLGL
jgi:hypothetical protein